MYVPAYFALFYLTGFLLYDIYLICRDSEDIEESEELDWRLKAIVIGMGSKGLLDLMLKTGAQVFTQGQSIFVHGNKKQRADLLDAVQRKTVSASKSMVFQVILL